MAVTVTSPRSGPDDGTVIAGWIVRDLDSGAVSPEAMAKQVGPRMVEACGYEPKAEGGRRGRDRGARRGRS